jgi:ATP-dependent Clp protease ATP-binding subunit ClpA
VAQARRDSEVRPIHLFLAAVEHPDGAAGRMLQIVGVDPEQLRRQVLDDESDESPDDESG